MIDGYTEICGVIQDIGRDIMNDESTNDTDENLFVLTGAYYIGYTVAIKDNTISKKHIGELLAVYCKDYALDCIEIYDTEIFYSFIFTWDAMQGSEKKLSLEEIRKCIKENKEEYEN